MKKLLVFLMVAGFLVAGSGLAVALEWQTTPVLGYSTYYDGNVNVVTATGTVVIPDSDYPNGPPSDGESMSLFYVGDTVDAGSGIYYGLEGNAYAWSVVYTGPGRTVSWADTYPGNSGEGFVMNYLDPVSTLTPADVGTWTYTETWTDLRTAGGEGSIYYSTTFDVAAVPEPATMLLLGLGLVGLAGVRRKFKA